MKLPNLEELWRLNFHKFSASVFLATQGGPTFILVAESSRLSNCSFGPFSAQKEYRSFLGDVELA